MEKVQNAKRRSRVEVYQTLKDSIQYLELMPGSIIHENELIEKIGVSRTPIREALIRLASEYLVDIYPQRGTYVSTIDFHLAHEVAYMRHVLDQEVCLKLCQQKVSLRDAVDEKLYFMSQAVKKGDVIGYIKNDNAFHSAIFAVAGHEMIWEIISNSRAHYNRMLVLDLQRPGVLEKSYQEHLDIVDMIEQGNEEELMKILDRHHDHQDMSEREREIRAMFPEYFANEDE
ncbi:MAG: GntR family transcriptional regulator [Butyricicoccus sp.]|nr:GntR family transcriptional regulator [Butyricicoccus sp.]